MSNRKIAHDWIGGISAGNPCAIWNGFRGSFRKINPIVEFKAKCQLTNWSPIEIDVRVARCFCVRPRRRRPTVTRVASRKVIAESKGWEGGKGFISPPTTSSVFFRPNYKTETSYLEREQQ